MPYAVGVDVGTTFTAAAVWRDERVEIVALETHHVTVPSVVFADGDDVFFGTAAATRGAAQPGGLAREFKRRLGDSLPLVLSGAPYSADRLVALFVRWVVDSISEQFGEAPSSVVVTHPANWTEFQLHLLTNALEQVGLGDAGLLSEPQAAAHDFGAAARLDRGELVLVYDLGGGTFDVALLRKDNGKFSHVGESAGVERLGGIDFDEAVFQHVVAHIPPDAITRARDDPSGRMAFAQLRRTCVEAKESLSSEVAVEIPVLLPGHTSTVRLTRAEFENMIRPMLGQTIDLSQRVLQTAGITPDALSAILLVGGSSRIPLVSELVRQQTGATVRVDAHPKLVVGRGAGRWAGERPVTAAAAAGGRYNHRNRVLAIGAGAALVAGGVFAFAVMRDSPVASPDVIENSGSTTAPAASTTSTTTTTSTSTTTTTTSPPIERVGQISWGAWGGGLQLMLGRDDGVVRLLDVDTGDELFEIAEHTDAVRGAFFRGPDGPFITVSDDGTARLWDGDGVRARFIGHVGPVNHAAWDPALTKVVTGGADGTVRTWDAESGESLAVYPGDGTGVSLVSWSPDGTSLAVGQASSIEIADANSGELLRTLVGHADTVTSIRWIPATDQLISSSDDGTVRIWDVDRGETVFELNGHTAPVLATQWRTREREHLGTNSLDGTARVWEMSSGEQIQILGDEGGPAVVSMSFRPGGSMLATGGDDGVVRLWDVDSGEHIGSLTGHSSPIIWTVWSRQNRILALGEDGTARVFDADTLEEIYFFAE